ncbi:MAG: ribonuclease catalytic domain-containing protein [Deltaproteobacteria bacterium]
MIKRIPKHGEVIIFRKRKEPSLGVITEGAGAKFSVFSEEGKEVEVDYEKVVLPAGIKLSDELNQSEKKLALRGLRRELDESVPKVDLKTIWECVFDLGAEITLDEIIELYLGKDSSTRQKEALLLFWAIEKTEVYFKRGECGYIPHTVKDVEDIVHRRELESKKIAERRAAVKWARAIAEERDDSSADAGDFAGFVELLKGYVIHLDKFERATDAKSFMAESGIRDVEGALEFLIKAGCWREDEDPILRRLGVDGRFPKKATEELRRIIDDSAPEEGVEDLTHLEAYSVDDETTEDIDDAISLTETQEGFTLGVHIANVAAFIPKWSPLDEEAARRGETIYIPEGHIHMFPKELIREKLSLFQGASKLSLSLLASFDETFNLRSYRFTQSKIAVRRNLTYTESENFFGQSSWGRKLIALSSALRKKRVDAGAFLVELPQIKIGIRQDGGITIRKIYMNTVANTVVSECMILMNWLAGRFLRDKEIPGVFRSQSEPISDDAKSLDENDPLFALRAVKFLKPARVGLCPEPHQSLGLDVYVQVTSPIRRYFDLVLHRQIIGELTGEGAAYSAEELERMYMQIELGLREKKMIQRTRDRYWLLKYLKDFEGREIRGVVSYVSDRGASAYLMDYLFETPIPVQFEMREGDEIALVVRSVDPLRRKISLVPVLYGAGAGDTISRAHETDASTS